MKVEIDRQIKNIYKYRPLIHELVVRDLKVKYRRSFLGYLWSLLNPLLMMGVMSLVFSYMFLSSIENYSLYLICGQTLFNFFSESTGMAMTSILNSASLIKKVYIPKYIFPISRVVSSFVTMAFSLGAILIVIIFTGADFYWTTFLAVVPIFFLLVFSCGIGLILSSLSVFFRDITHLWSVIVLAWTYLTPIFYSINFMPDDLQKIMKLNPLYHYLNLFRNLVMYGNIPGPNTWYMCIFSALVAFILGISIFNKLQSKFILHV